MAIQTVKVGAAVNDGTGDDARTAFTKINQNFTEWGNAASRLVGTEAGNVMEVGAFGLGAGAQVITGGNVTSLPNGFYDMNFFPGAPAQYGSAVRVVGDSGNWLHNIYFPANSMAPSIQTKINQTPWTGFNEFLVKGRNVITDANGFIKAASPIVQLFADRITANDEAKLQEITFEKLGAGDYLIKGSSGFAQEGWYTETPKDANGNALVAVVYEQLDNNDISVKTYDYMLNKKGRIVPDLKTPLDIPESRWIDLRLQALPQDDTQPLDTDETVATDAEQ